MKALNMAPLVLTAAAIQSGVASAKTNMNCDQLLVSSKMKAVGYLKSLNSDHPDALLEYSVPVPLIGASDILVKVRAISVNPVDTKVRKRAEAKESEPQILGWDASGTVEAIGSEVTAFTVGDEVYYAGDITRAGSNSELHAVDERLVAKKPRNLSFAEAASLPLTSLTAYEALFEQMGVKPSRTLLVIGGSGGVGSAAIQIAKVAGLKVVATASRPETIDWARKMGADFVINHREPLAPQLRVLGLPEVDYILNTADTHSYWNQMAEIIRPFGKITSIVESAQPVDLTLLMKKSVTFSWELMFTRSMFKTEDMQEQSKILERVAQWVEEGKIRTTLAQDLGPISGQNLRKAHQILESGTSVGKLVLSGW